MISRALIEKLLAFRADRDWEQFHNLRTLSTSIVLEAAELAEFSQWAKDAELEEIVEARRQEIEHEVADLAILPLTWPTILESMLKQRSPGSWSSMADAIQSKKPRVRLANMTSWINSPA